MSILELAGRVHNLTVDGGEFFANDILTHNCDELAAWQYVDQTWDMAVLGLRLGDDPRALITTTPKPIPLLRELIETGSVAVTKGTTYDNRPNLAPPFFDELITKYEGTRLGRQELDAELLLDEGLAYRLVHGVHVVPPIVLPETWQRFEAMDWGGNHPTAWPCLTVDYEGNLIVHDMHYGPGLVSEHAPEILRRRKDWYPRGMPQACYAPADIKARWFGRKGPTGREITIESEFADHGITFVTAQQDRRAGYMRVAELLKLDEEHKFPEWHERRGEPGAPRLYFADVSALEPMVKQLRDAPLESADSPLSRFPGEAVDQAWESEHGHAHAALRYAVMSRPSVSKRPPEVITDPRLARRMELRKRALDPRRNRLMEV